MQRKSDDSWSTSIKGGRIVEGKKFGVGHPSHDTNLTSVRWMKNTNTQTHNQRIQVNKIINKMATQQKREVLIILVLLLQTFQKSY